MLLFVVLNDIITGWLVLQLSLQFVVVDITGVITDDPLLVSIFDRFLYMNDAIVIFLFGGKAPGGISSESPLLLSMASID